MVLASQGFFSMNWNSGEPTSKRHTRINEIAKVISVVHSATQRALRAIEASSPRIAMINNAPSSGRNVVTERIGQLAMSVPPNGKDEPSDEGRNTDQHGKRVVVHIAGLQTHDVASDVQHARRHAVGTESVDQPAVATFPQQATAPQRRPHDEEVVELVEIPLVEQKPVEHCMLSGEFDRQFWLPD